KPVSPLMSFQLRSIWLLLAAVAVSPVGAASGEGGASAAAALTMPPLAVLPARAGSGVVVLTMRLTTWAAVRLGFWLSTRPATPLTCGVAIDVPLLKP